MDKYPLRLFQYDGRRYISIDDLLILILGTGKEAMTIDIVIEKLLESRNFSTEEES